MSKDTREIYRLSVKKGDRIFKALSHSVEEDESLFVMNRNPPRPRHIITGIPRLGENGLGLDNCTSTDTRSHHIHYHPSGIVIVKARDNRLVARIQAPPMPMLKNPFLVFYLSVARVEQLQLENRQPAFGDHVIDVSSMDASRLQIECWVGPKRSFDGPFQWNFGAAQRIVYGDAGFYDVAYFAGAGAPIDPSIEIDGVRLSETCLTGTPFTNIVEPSTLPTLSPESWASPGAVARQLRASLEKSVSRLAKKLEQTGGCYEIRVSLCSDGVVAAIDWNASRDAAGFSWQSFNELKCESILEILGCRELGGPSRAIDVFERNPSLVDGLADTVFVRTRKSSGSLHNALVFRGSELLAGRYWRIPPQIIKNINALIDLVHCDSPLPSE